MFVRFSKVAAITALILALAGCNRNSTTQTAPANAPAEAAAPAAPTPAAEKQPPAVPPGTELVLNAVNSVMLSRPSDAPGAIVIHVSGFASSAGWTTPKLAEQEDAGGDASIRTYKFVATSPLMPEPASEQMVETELRIDALPPEVKTIRIVSATNEVAAPVTQ